MIVFILVGCLLCILGFAWRNNKLAAGLPADEKTALDGRFYDLKKNRFLYGPQEVDALFTNLEKNQNLQLYAITEITLDLVFPLLYTLLMIFLMVRVFPPKIAQYLIFLPILAGIGDLLENFTIAFLAFTFQAGQLSNLSTLAAAFTGSKWILVFISLLVLLIGWIRSLWKREKGQTKEEI